MDICLNVLYECTVSLHVVRLYATQYVWVRAYILWSDHIDLQRVSYGRQKRHSLPILGTKSVSIIVHHAQWAEFCAPHLVDGESAAIMSKRCTPRQKRWEDMFIILFPYNRWAEFGSWPYVLRMFSALKDLVSLIIAKILLYTNTTCMHPPSQRRRCAWWNLNRKHMLSWESPNIWTASSFCIGSKCTELTVPFDFLLRSTILSSYSSYFSKR